MDIDLTSLDNEYPAAQNIFIVFVEMIATIDMSFNMNLLETITCVSMYSEYPWIAQRDITYAVVTFDILKGSVRYF